MKLTSGLRYEDLLNRDKPDIAEAIELADPDVITGRMRRLKRASDLCLKQKRFQDYADTSNLDCFKEELWPDVERIQQRDEEYALLNMYKK